MDDMMLPPRVTCQEPIAKGDAIPRAIRLHVGPAAHIVSGQEQPV